MNHAGGVSIDWGMEHADSKGRVICRACRLIPPDGYEKASDRNIRLFIRRSIMFVLLSKYNEYRMRYAESNRNKEIPQKYRTGEPMPWTIKGACWEIVKLRIRQCF